MVRSKKVEPRFFPSLEKYPRLDSFERSQRLRVVLGARKFFSMLTDQEVVDLATVIQAQREFELNGGMEAAAGEGA